VLTLYFEHPLSRKSHRIGPAPYFRIIGRSLRAGPEDQEVGFYEQGMWHIGGESYITATTDAPIIVHFEGEENSPSPAHGPLESVKLVDGAIRHGPQLMHVLARYDEGAQAWYSYPDQLEHSTAVLAAPTNGDS
jgi:hypothetical protein